MLLLSDSALEKMWSHLPAQPVHGVRFVPYKEANSLPCDVVLHRAMYDATMQTEDPRAADRYRQLTVLDSTCIPLDPCLRVLPFADRGALASMIAQAGAAQPKFVIVRSPVDDLLAATSTLCFPLLCKPMVACGSKQSHQLAVALNPAGLSQLSPPLFVQEFVPHGGRLLKVYCLGTHVRVVERTSLPDICPCAEEPGLVRFNSQTTLPTAEHFASATPLFADVASTISDELRASQHARATQIASKISCVFGVSHVPTPPCHAVPRRATTPRRRKIFCVSCCLL